MKTSAWTLSPETKFSQTRVSKYVTKREPETFRFRVSVLFFPAVSITWPFSPTLECQAVKRQTGNPYFTLYHSVWSCFCSNFQTKTFLPRSSMCNLFQALHLLSLVFSPRSVPSLPWPRCLCLSINGKLCHLNREPQKSKTAAARERRYSFLWKHWAKCGYSAGGNIFSPLFIYGNTGKYLKPSDVLCFGTVKLDFVFSAGYLSTMIHTSSLVQQCTALTNFIKIIFCRQD